MVERSLAKAEVAGSSPVSRSKRSAALSRLFIQNSAPWPSGKARVCKTLIPGSIPGGASRNRCTPKRVHLFLVSLLPIEAGASASGSMRAGPADRQSRTVTEPKGASAASPQSISLRRKGACFPRVPWSRSVHLLGCKRPHNGSLSLPTFCGYAPSARITASPLVLKIFSLSHK